MGSKNMWLGVFAVTCLISVLVPFFWPQPPQAMISLPISIINQVSSLGTNPGKPTIIEFGDIESWRSRSHSSLVMELRFRFPEVNYVFLHFPSQQNLNGQVAAVLLECARDENKFYAVLDAFLALPDITQQNLIDATATAGADANAIWECAKSGAKEDIIQQHLQWASQTRLNIAPKIFVNGNLLGEPYSARNLEQGFLEAAR